MKNRPTRLTKVSPAGQPSARAALVRLVGFLPVLAVTMAAGPCGKEPLGSVDGAVSCPYEGKVYRPGASIPATDGCNTCTCNNDGLLVCTHQTCLDGGSDGASADLHVMCFDEKGNEIPCGDGGAIADAVGRCFDGNGNPISCEDAGTTSSCTYQGVKYAKGATIPLGDCRRCTCDSNNFILCDSTSCADAGANGSGVCLQGKFIYELGATFPADDGCNTCICTAAGVACTAISCPDAGPSRDAGVITGVCKPGQDSTCNEDPFASTLRGKCQADGSCLCNGAGTSGVVSPYTGKCLGPDNLTGDGCELYKTYPVSSTFPCGDSSCTTCTCASPGKVTVVSSSCSDAGAPSCGLDAVYVYGDVGGRKVSQDQVTIAPSPSSPKDQATYVRTRSNVDGAAGISCNPPFPACGDPTAIDVSDIMADLQDAVVQKYLTLDPSSQPFLGFDTRPADGTAFSFMRGDGHGFLVGQACGTSSSAGSCFAIPPAVDKLVKDLRALDDQQLRAASCAALR